MAVLPGARKSGEGERISKGSLVLYEHEGSPYLAVIEDSKKERYVLWNMRGRRVELPANRLHLLPGALPGGQSDSGSEQAARLLELFEEGLASAKEIDLAEIWTLVHDEEQEFTTGQLCELYFGNNELKQHLALRLALLDDHIFFKRKREVVAPRPASTIEELKRAETLKAEREGQLELLLAEFETRAQQHPADRTPFPDEFQGMIRFLEEIAAGAAHIDNARVKDAMDLVKAAEDRLQLNRAYTREDRVYNLLRRIGHFHRNTNLAFVRHGVPIRFSEEALQEADQIRQPSEYTELPAEEREYRLDLSSLPAFTVDDPSTFDMDDAISIERTRDGFRVGVHITDVAACLPLESALDREASYRATSIYCPERTINMLPDKLAEDELSLVVGQGRRAISCLISVNHNLEFERAELRHTFIRVTARRDYREVEEALLRRDQDVEYLYTVSSGHQMSRLTQGAMQIPKRMVYLKLTNPAELHRTAVEIEEVDENGPARSLVSELMVFTNKVFAEFAVAHEVPLIFRTQPAPDPSEQRNPLEVPAGPAQDYVLRSTLKRSEVSVTAGLHATLGLKAYAQATSPIRRFADLVNQRQVAAALLGHPLPYTGEALEKIVEQTRDPLRKANQVTKESRKFWLLKYLEQRLSSSDRIRATVLRTDMRSPLIELDEIYLPIPLRTKERLLPGDSLVLRITGVDARKDLLRLEILERETPGS